MEPKTKKQIEEMIESHEDLMERINRIAYPLGRLIGKSPDSAEECDLTFDCISIYLEWDEYDRWDGHSIERMNFPIEYLWGDIDEILIKISKELKEEKGLKEEAEQQEKLKEQIKKAEEKEIRDHAKYLKLKEKYERGAK